MSSHGVLNKCLKRCSMISTITNSSFTLHGHVHLTCTGSTTTPISSQTIGTTLCTYYVTVVRWTSGSHISVWTYSSRDALIGLAPLHFLALDVDSTGSQHDVVRQVDVRQRDQVVAGRRRRHRFVVVDVWQMGSRLHNWWRHVANRTKNYSYIIFLISKLPLKVQLHNRQRRAINCYATRVTVVRHCPSIDRLYFDWLQSIWPCDVIVNFVEISWSR